MEEADKPLDEDENKLSKRRRSRPTSAQFWKMIFGFGSINFFMAMVYSLPSPFYPKEAELKGLSKSEYGLVIGSFELTQFLVAPIIGNYLHKVRAINAYNFGIVMVGLFVAIFGFMDRVNGHIPFLLLSFLLRMLEAIGSSIAWLSSYSIAINRFPDDSATTFGLLELMFGLGSCTGPIVGEGLYIIGGFQLPFFVLGALVLVTGLIIFLQLRFEGIGNDEEAKNNTNSEGKLGYCKLLVLPVIALQAFCIMAAAINLSFLLTVLEPHVRQFNLQPMAVGAMFFSCGLAYAIFSPIFGKICDYLTEPSYLTLLSLCSAFIAYSMLGPAPFLTFEPNVTLFVVGLVLIGISTAGVFVSAFSKALAEATLRQSFQDPSSLVSGMWMSLMSFGMFVGPSTSGILNDQFDFRHATFFVLGLNALLIGLIVSYLCIKSYHRSNLDELEMGSGNEDDEQSELLGQN